MADTQLNKHPPIIAKSLRGKWELECIATVGKGSDTLYIFGNYLAGLFHIVDGDGKQLACREKKRDAIAKAEELLTAAVNAGG